jgi:phage repressor protein C with HTH and peptisase S24 domain
MTIDQRLKLAVKWLVANGVAGSQKEIGFMLGYKSESSFSQILNGKVPIPKGLIEKTRTLHSDINSVWIETGEGDMLKNQSNVKYISPYLSEDLIKIPYVPINAAASFVESLYGEPYIDETFGVLFEDGEYTNHTEYRVFNISGDSMEPTIRNRSKVLCKEISRENWEYAKGVIVIVYGKTLTIKRILKNDLYIHNTLSLKADNPTYGEITVERSEIKGIWQALRVVSMEIV